MATTQEKMEQQFAEAQKRALKAVEEEISALYQDGQEEVNFRFDAFPMWGMNNAGPTFWKNFPVGQVQTDDWYRAVWNLNKADALAIAKYVEEWNAPWEYAIAGKFLSELHQVDPEFDQNEYYNAYHVSFCSASGSEHQISVSTGGRYTADGWQWN